MPARHPVALRLDDHEMRIVKRTIEQLAIHNPHWQPTQSDAIRHLICTSGGVAVPAGTTTMPDQKPMRSG